MEEWNSCLQHSSVPQPTRSLSRVLLDRQQTGLVGLVNAGPRLRLLTQSELTEGVAWRRHVGCVVLWEGINRRRLVTAERQRREEDN